MLLHCLGLVLWAVIRATQCCLTVLTYWVFFILTHCYCLYCGQIYDDGGGDYHTSIKG